ncbi:hypothetical protein THAOC_09597 [Thalassiosira oceanica]|uniref:carnosine N-methyltransferase n=1 Tax=Thalassiosira oceanica TaxID=159749 RepID=K0SW67_THAOC|nr:hypothetical protein THAOC_09597 [Thalassiosira oceanica]|eukprot:EJK69179.1 hypothetical protein THAOC_09597 [Thalassiosira oceanica]
MDGSGGGWEATFFCQAGDEAIFRELNTALRSYREMSDAVIHQLSLSHEVAAISESLLFSDANSERDAPAALPSKRLEHIIARSAEALEHNVFVLEKILRPFPCIASSEIEVVDTVQSSSFVYFEEGIRAAADGSGSHRLAMYISPYNARSDLRDEDESYNSASHIITHLTRDWSADSAPIRKDTYGWIVDQLWAHHISADDDGTQARVLVPGAGTGRLAYDLVFAAIDDSEEEKSEPHYPFAVEAVDCSIPMATAAYYVFHQKEESFKMFPFVSDPFMNEVNSEKRYNSTYVPESSVIDTLKRIGGGTQQSSVQKPHLTYVIGDFVKLFSMPSRHDAFDYIATCFFIDTASNIFEYLLTIKHAIRPKGLWINLGPVQWHRNAQLGLSADELKDLVRMAGFDIVVWEVSEELVPYRHPDDVTGTRAEFYRPLRFVVRSRNENLLSPQHSLQASIEKLRATTGRKSLLQDHRAEK